MPMGYRPLYNKPRFVLWIEITQLTRNNQLIKLTVRNIVLLRILKVLLQFNYPLRMWALSIMLLTLGSGGHTIKLKLIENGDVQQQILQASDQKLQTISVKFELLICQSSLRGNELCL